MSIIQTLQNYWAGMAAYDRCHPPTFTSQWQAFKSEASEKRIRIPSANRKLFRADLPLSSGQYVLRDVVHSGFLLPYDFETAEYTFSLNVVSAPDISSVAAAEEIPEASNLAGLVCLGLGGWLLKLTKTRGRKMRSQM